MYEKTYVKKNLSFRFDEKKPLKPQAEMTEKTCKDYSIKNLLI